MRSAPAVEFARLPPGFEPELPDPRRARPEQLARETQLASRNPIVTALLDALDSVLLVLNERRQIVAFSAGAAGAAGCEQLSGRRPGEALGCVNAQSPAGCGAAPACRSCGALRAIAAVQRTGRPAEAECLLRSVVGGGSAFEFGVRAAPVDVEGERFIVLSLRDLSAEKRREALEQTFLHDVLNTVAGVRGWAVRLRAPGCDVPRATERLDFLTRQLERELRDHRDLVSAERGTLHVEQLPVACAQLLRDVESAFASQAVGRDRQIVVEAPPEVEVRTDPALLFRVLGNMLRNALEATEPGGTVRLRAELEAGAAVRFSVHNASVMPPDVQERVFVRSFTTKAGRGRGLGTYGMKLIGERHLGGEVAFASSAGAGTTFWIRLPRAGPAA